MFKIWFTNFRYWASGEWSTLEAAIEAAKGFGFECSVQEYIEPQHAFLDRAFVSPLRGVEMR